jgi:acyl-coenzyme A thioesterase PaaI-like protein
MDLGIVQSLIGGGNSSEALNDEIQNRIKERQNAELEDGELSLDDEAELKAYQKANSTFTGEVIELKESYAKVRLIPNEDMVVDDYNLINQGFIFSAAHLGAMAAINNHRAMITNSHVKFLAPIELGNIIEFEANAKRKDMRKSEVKVIGKLLGIKIFEADFSAVKLDKHPLKLKLAQETKKKESQ